MYPLLSSKLRTRVKGPLHTDQVILQFYQRADPKELFAPKDCRLFGEYKIEGFCLHYKLMNNF